LVVSKQRPKKTPRGGRPNKTIRALFQFSKSHGALPLAQARTDAPIAEVPIMARHAPIPSEKKASFAHDGNVI
jgi:ribosomal protein L10